MATEVYKLEVGTNLGTHVTQWAFYWEVNNTSGRSHTEISWDIAQSLDGFLGWFYRFRDFWNKGNTTKIYRIRRVWPTIDYWNDYFQYFKSFGGRFIIKADLLCVKVRVKWFTDRWEIDNACTYFNQWPNFVWEDFEATGVNFDALGDWAKNHIGPHTTAEGDTFRPVILDKYGNYSPIIAYWLDPRPVASRVHRWRG